MKCLQITTCIPIPLISDDEGDDLTPPPAMLLIDENQTGNTRSTRYRTASR